MGAVILLGVLVDQILAERKRRKVVVISTEPRGFPVAPPASK
jgi:hypothetical protein